MIESNRCRDEKAHDESYCENIARAPSTLPLSDGGIYISLNNTTDAAHSFQKLGTALGENPIQSCNY